MRKCNPREKRKVFLSKRDFADKLRKIRITVFTPIPFEEHGNVLETLLRLKSDTPQKSPLERLDPLTGIKKICRAKVSTNKKQKIKVVGDRRHRHQPPELIFFDESSREIRGKERKEREGFCVFLDFFYSILLLFIENI